MIDLIPIQSIESTTNSAPGNNFNRHRFRPGSCGAAAGQLPNHARQLLGSSNRGPLTHRECIKRNTMIDLITVQSIECTTSNAPNNNFNQHRFRPGSCRTAASQLPGSCLVVPTEAPVDASRIYLSKHNDRFNSRLEH